VDEVAAQLRAAHAPALATLTRILRDIDLAEEALQDATLRALRAWRASGLPDQPVAWLVHAGRNAALDRIRRRRVEARHREAAPPAPLPPGAEERLQVDALGLHLHDDLLRLIFTCCHPSLPTEEQVALTLRALAGLSVEEIARAFLVAPRAMEQRITRAKRRIREQQIPYEVPRPDQLEERLRPVLAVVYLVLNEGHKATAGEALVRDELCALSIRLGRLLLRLFPSEPEVMSVTALALLHHARREARSDPLGELITLDRQDRRRWDAGLLSEGFALVEKALRRAPARRYAIEAAIAASHCRAASYEETDWAEIAALYERLEHVHPSPVVRLNRAVAVSRCLGAAAGLALLVPIESRREMADYLPYHAARAALLAEAGRLDEARSAYRRALPLALTRAERVHLTRKVAELA
jgi:RNA polymerase sigma-70 factor (ECF subfamily)